MFVASYYFHTELAPEVWDAEFPSLKVRTLMCAIK